MNVKISHKVWFSIGATLGLLVLVWTVGAVLAQSPGPEGEVQPQADVSIAATVNSRISYQGLLKENGQPVTGSRNLVFRFYTTDSCLGPPVQSVTKNNVDVTNGLFSVEDLDVDHGNFNGQGLWLAVEVAGTPVGCQEILPVPYALSLRPGAEIEGEPTAWEGWVLKVNMDGTYPLGKAVWGSTATGSAIRGQSAGGYGVYGYSDDGYAVYGRDAGATRARGYGGYFTSDNGVGIFGYSGAQSSVGNMHTPGVYGRSANGVGVYGLTDSPYAWTSGVRGESANGVGVYGVSDERIGVYGTTKGTSSDDYGVYGIAGGSAYGVHGYQSNTTSGLGVFGKNEGGGSGVSGYNAGNGNGTWGYSSGYNGVGGMTGRVDNNYGLHTPDNLYSLNYHLAGAVMQVAQNGDAEPLERGDVVVLAGLGASPAEDVPPIPQVRRAREANSTAVVGVVASTYSSEWLTDPSSDPTGAAGPDKDIPLSGQGPVAPGEYLLIVVQGPCEVKMDATAAAVQPGDLLSAAGRAGYAARSAELKIEGVRAAPPGTVLGKAMEALDAGRAGSIYVFVTLQ